MNNYPLGSPEANALERLKTMRLISPRGLIDEQASELIDEISVVFREWHQCELEAALDDAADRMEADIDAQVSHLRKALRVKFDDIDKMIELLGTGEYRETYMPEGSK